MFFSVFKIMLFPYQNLCQSFVLTECRIFLSADRYFRSDDKKISLSKESAFRIG